MWHEKLKWEDIICVPVLYIFLFILFMWFLLQLILIPFGIAYNDYKVRVGAGGSTDKEPIWVRIKPGHKWKYFKDFINIDPTKYYWSKE